MRVAIHQPNYMPYIGYFYKMFLADVFVFLDNVPFSKSSYTRRVKVRKEAKSVELRWLTIPVQKYHEHTLINQLQPAADDWFEVHKRKLATAYSKSPLYSKIIGLVEYAVAEAASNSVSDINQSIIAHIANYLYINPDKLLASNLNLSMQEVDVNLQIVKHLTIDTYVSGRGADSYQDLNGYKTADIAVEYADINTFLDSPEGLLFNTQQAVVSASIFDWLMYYSNTEILELFRAAKASTSD